MHKKIIFLDVDGTLVDFHGDLPESAPGGGAAGQSQRASAGCMYGPAESPDLSAGARDGL